MPIDSSIYQNVPKSILNYGLQGYDQGRQSLDADFQRRGLMAQRQREDAQRVREQAFNQNLSGLLGSYGPYANTPEGQRDIFQKMSGAGYAKEMIGLMGGIPQVEKPEKDKYSNVMTEQGAVPFNENKGTYGEPATINGKPVYSPEVADKRKKGEADFNFGKAIPTYEAQLRAIGGDMTKRDLLASQIMADHPDSPKAEKYITTVLKTQSPYAVSAAAPSQSAQDKWVDFLGNKGDYQTFIQGMSGIRGPNRGNAIVDILARTKAKYPDFDVVGAKAGIKQAEDAGNNKVLNLISGVLPNVQNLVALSDKINRSGIKVVSRAELAASRQFSDQDMANFDAMKNLTADEINQIFAGGKGGSDMSRHMALDLINEQLPPKQFASTMKTLYTAMQNRANGIRSGFQGYGGARAAAQPTDIPTAHPQDSEAVSWAKAHPEDPRSAKILKANGL